MNNQGALTIPFVLFLVAGVSFGFGSLKVMNQWHRLAATQQRLDKCVGKTAMTLKSSIRNIEKLNQSIHTTRVALMATTLAPEVAAALRIFLNLQVLAQKTLLAAWKAEQVKWLARRGCDGSPDIPFPLPSQPWHRGPPDFIGPQALRWAHNNKTELKIRLSNHPRVSSAVVRRQNDQWEAVWAGFI